MNIPFSFATAMAHVLLHSVWQLALLAAAACSRRSSHVGPGPIPLTKRQTQIATSPNLLRMMPGQ